MHHQNLALHHSAITVDLEKCITHARLTTCAVAFIIAAQPVRVVLFVVVFDVVGAAKGYATDTGNLVDVCHSFLTVGSDYFTFKDH
jgi:pyrimidine deaminase RibD-like protein